MQQSGVLKVFFVSSSPSADVPRPGPTFQLSAGSVDALGSAARDRLADEGFGTLRSLTFGPGGLVAYVEAPR